MDAVEFLLEKSRMCKSHSHGCLECELYKDSACDALKTRKQAYKTIAIVEKWSKEHPEKTRQSEFLKEYPNVSLNLIDGYPSMNPCELDHTLYKKSRCDVGCTYCREQYWTEEVK